MTIKTHQSSKSRAVGLLYSQLYASMKKVFATGDVYPFTNVAIETLALDPKLRKRWQHVGAGLSHDPIALVRPYLYTKLHYHHATRGSIRKSFWVREEHRVSVELFTTIDAQFRYRQLDVRLTREGQKPFYTFTTSTVLSWLRCNINKFCVGFEMVFSLNDCHLIIWEHTRAMLIFLRCLQFSYSSGLIQRAGGCWQDVRYQADINRPDWLGRSVGLGFRDTMRRHGYAWFMDKVDWETMTFRQPFAQYMMFNNPSIQAACYTRYSQVRDVRIDFIRVDKVRQWMIEFSAVPTCLNFLEEYLRQVCLYDFRKDVFSQIKSSLHKHYAEKALAGRVGLCWPSVDRVMKDGHRLPQLAGENRLAVKSIEVLFVWLWEWKDGHYERARLSRARYRVHVMRALRPLFRKPSSN